MKTFGLQCVFGIFVSILAIVANAVAEDDFDEWAGFAPEDQYDPVEFTGLFGDLNGFRTKLAEQGFTFDFDVMQSYVGALSGGIENTGRYGGSGEIDFQFDLEKMGLWPGAFVNGRATSQFGRFVNEDTGMITAAYTPGMWPLPGYDGVALPELVFTQFLSENVSVFFGKMDTTSGDSTRFSGARGKDNFMNANLVFNPVAVRLAPLSALGGGLLFFWPDAQAERPTTLSLSVLGANGMPNTVGWDDDFEDGAAYTISVRHPTNLWGKEGAHTCTLVYNDRDYTILDQDPRLFLENLAGLSTTTNETGGSWGAMYNFDQFLYQEAQDETQGVGVFGRFGLADDEVNPFYQFYSIGLGGKGIIEGRDEDTFGIGYYYTVDSDELPQAIQSRFGDAQGFEVFYNIEATPWLHITPDFQVLQSGDRSVDVIYVGGVRVKLEF
jgi:porin